MTIPRHHSLKTEYAQYLLLALPTIALMTFGIYLCSQWLDFLSDRWILISAFFSVGIFASLFCFARRLRFVTISFLFLLIFTFVTWLSQKILTGEFDSFNFGAGFNNFLVLFAAGWISGYGFSRSRFITVAWAVILLSVLLLVIAQISQPAQSSIIWSAAPVMVYVVYIIYISELLRNVNQNQTRFGWFVLRKILTFGLLFGTILIAAIYLMKPEFKTIEKQWGEGGNPKKDNQNKYSLTREDGMGKTIQSSMGLQGFNNRANKDSLLFVARLDNFFSGSDIPNPLYFVSDYYTRFDSIAQSFETDTLRPFDDLFRPDLLSLPLYYTSQDSSVIEKTMATQNLKVATAEVFKTGLSPRHFTAPSTAFFVQPISVPIENQEYYKSAYRVKMLVSELNSAYFVYNPAGDPGLHLFQQQRFEALRRISDFSAAPAGFLEYYTHMPKGSAYDSIHALALSITDTAGPAPIDKIIAIRNFFTATDSTGNPTFRYSDNPGIPGIPGANRLSHFLFESKKGYCAYYAGATLFLLRSLGIPSRIATGFLTVDRSNKNPGWYWFYEDQAHAWVQAWFPGFGWLDFDTTVSSNETQEAPQPDQTPPLTAQTARLVANGSILTIDSSKAKLKLNVSDVLFKDIPFSPSVPFTIELDLSMARVSKNSGQILIGALKHDMRIVAVSFSDVFKDVVVSGNETWESVVKKWPTPIPVDEVKVMEPPHETQVVALEQKKLNIPWTKIAIIFLLSVAVIGTVVLTLPFILFRWFIFKANKAKDIQQKAYHQYMASMLYMHQLGIKKNILTPLLFAEHKIDPIFGTNLASFIRVYEKLKYSRHVLSEYEKEIIRRHLPDFLNCVRKQIPFRKRFMALLNINNTIEFFTQPNMLGSSKSMDIWNKI